MKTKLLGAIALALLASSPASAVTIGAANTNNCAPFGCSVAENWDYYQIYSAGAFDGHPVTFNTITLFDSGVRFGPYPMDYGHYQISFGITSDPLGIDHAPSLSHVRTFFDGILGQNFITGQRPFPVEISISGSNYTYVPSLGNLVMHVVATDQIYPVSCCQFLDADGSGAMSQYVSGTGFSPYSQQIGLITEFTHSVPEPSTWALMLLGFAGIGFVAYRRQRGRGSARLRQAA